jgi:hypothetical protein
MSHNESWESDSDHSGVSRDPGPSSSTILAPKRKKIRIKTGSTKRRKTGNCDKPEVTGSNMRSIYSALTKDKNIMHDFGKILKAKITGSDVHLSELRTAAQVGTRSTVDDVIKRDDVIETRSRQKKTKLASLGNITTFSKAELPSDDSDDDFNISGSTLGKPEVTGDDSPTGSHADSSSEASEIEPEVILEEEESQFSIKSEESLVIAKKTRSKIKITDPIENIVESFKPPDYDEFEESLLRTTGNDQPEVTGSGEHCHYSKFLNDTFVNDISHADDDDDEDFNPNEFIDDLLDLNKDEITNGVISRKEARDLQCDLLEFLLPEPTIVLNQTGSNQTGNENYINDVITIENEPEVEPEVIESEPPVGFTIESYTKLITQMHMNVQILGQSILMARHNSKWENEYLEFKENILFKNDKLLFSFIEQIQSSSLVEVEEVREHACQIRDESFLTPTGSNDNLKAEMSNSTYAILSFPVCRLFLESRLFPFYQLYPQLNKVWFNSDTSGLTSGHSPRFKKSPGHENLFVLYLSCFIREYSRKPKNQIEILNFFRKKQFMNWNSDQEIVKMFKNLNRRKGNPIEKYLNFRIFPRQNSFCINTNDSFLNFTSTKEKLEKYLLGNNIEIKPIQW